MKRKGAGLGLLVGLGFGIVDEINPKLLPLSAAAIVLLAIYVTVYSLINRK